MSGAALHLSRLIISANGVNPGDNHWIYVCDVAAPTSLSVDLDSCVLQLNISYSGTTVVDCGFNLSSGLVLRHTTDAYGKAGTASTFSNICVTAVTDTAL